VEVTVPGTNLLAALVVLAVAAVDEARMLEDLALPVKVILVVLLVTAAVEAVVLVLLVPMRQAV
tara:strand:+ start:294 stop:485 length:192 start_codon:yes stop_codon:yes gene_type:complete